MGASRLGTPRPLVSFRKSFGDPGVIRTRDLRFRKPLLYPAELRGQARRRLIPGAASAKTYAVHMAAGQALPPIGAVR